MRRRWLAVVALWSAVALGALWAAPWLWPYPYALDHGDQGSFVLVDRDGLALREAVGTGGERAVWRDLDELSPWVVAATVAIEDRRFYEHGGIDPRGVARAMWSNLREGRVVSGASTLSMQTARLHADHPRSGWGKVKQALDAVRLERVASKEQILEQYLNRAPYGAGTRGVEAAAQRTFGKPSKHLSLAEAALLAGLVQAPSAFHPFVDEAAAVRRQHQVLDAMRATGAISSEQHARAWAEPLVFRDGSPRPEAMHFTDAVLATSPEPGRVQTTLARADQRRVQDLVREHVRALRHGGLNQAAVVVLDNDTCAVRVMVGSADWWSGPDGSVNGAMALRQPGSALKPFAYATAWERGGYDPGSVVADIPTRYVGAGGALMRPANYSENFSGPVLMGEALGRSLNIPAVRTANATGIEHILDDLRAVGLSSLDQSAAHYGLGLVLGNGEVRPIELAVAYATLARGGVSCTARWTADDPVAPGQRVYSERTAALVTRVLADDALRARAFGANNPLQLGFPVAVKTGTSTNFRDSWTAGYTEDFTVVVWAGDFGGEPMSQLSGAVGAGPLFRDVMRYLVGQGSVAQMPHELPLPPDVVELELCSLSGGLPGPGCARRRVPVPREAEVREPCPWHRVVRVDRRNGLLASDRCPAEYVVERVVEDLPAEYAAWQAESGNAPPRQWSPLCPPDGVTADAVVVVHPRPGDVFLVEPGYRRDTQTLELSVEVDPPVPEVRWWVDGEPVERSAWPYAAAWALAPGEHVVVAEAGGRRSEPVAFEVR